MLEATDGEAPANLQDISNDIRRRECKFAVSQTFLRLWTDDAETVPWMKLTPQDTVCHTLDRVLLQSWQKNATFNWDLRRNELWIDFHVPNKGQFLCPGIELPANVRWKPKPSADRLKEIVPTFQEAIAKLGGSSPVEYCQGDAYMIPTYIQKIWAQGQFRDAVQAMSRDLSTNEKSKLEGRSWAVQRRGLVTSAQTLTILKRLGRVFSVVLSSRFVQISWQSLVQLFVVQAHAHVMQLLEFGGPLLQFQLLNDRGSIEAKAAALSVNELLQSRKRPPSAHWNTASATQLNRLHSRIERLLSKTSHGQPFRVLELVGLGDALRTFESNALGQEYIALWGLIVGVLVGAIAIVALVETNLHVTLDIVGFTSDVHNDQIIKAISAIPKIIMATLEDADFVTKVLRPGARLLQRLLARTFLYPRLASTNADITIRDIDDEVKAATDTTHDGSWTAWFVSLVRLATPNLQALLQDGRKLFSVLSKTSDVPENAQAEHYAEMMHLWAELDTAMPEWLDVFAALQHWSTGTLARTLDALVDRPLVTTTGDLITLGHMIRSFVIGSTASGEPTSWTSAAGRFVLRKTAGNVLTGEQSFLETAFFDYVLSFAGITATNPTPESKVLSRLVERFWREFQGYEARRVAFWRRAIEGASRFSQRLAGNSGEIVAGEDSAPQLVFLIQDDMPNADARFLVAERENDDLVVRMRPNFGTENRLSHPETHWFVQHGVLRNAAWPDRLIRRDLSGRLTLTTGQVSNPVLAWSKSSHSQLLEALTNDNPFVLSNTKDAEGFKIDGVRSFLAREHDWRSEHTAFEQAYFQLRTYAGGLRLCYDPERQLARLRSGWIEDETSHWFVEQKTKTLRPRLAPFVQLAFPRESDCDPMIFVPEGEDEKATLVAISETDAELEKTLELRDSSAEHVAGYKLRACFELNDCDLLSGVERCPTIKRSTWEKVKALAHWQDTDTTFRVTSIWKPWNAEETLQIQVAVGTAQQQQAPSNEPEHKNPENEDIAAAPLQPTLPEEFRLGFSAVEYAGLPLCWLRREPGGIVTTANQEDASLWIETKDGFLSWLGDDAGFVLAMDQTGQKDAPLVLVKDPWTPGFSRDEDNKLMFEGRYLRDTDFERIDEPKLAQSLKKQDGWAINGKGQVWQLLPNGTTNYLVQTGPDEFGLEDVDPRQLALRITTDSQSSKLVDIKGRRAGFRRPVADPCRPDEYSSGEFMVQNVAHPGLSLWSSKHRRFDQFEKLVIKQEKN